MRHAELKVISGKQAGSVIPLPEGKFLIGREEDCHLRPNSDLVSRHHCVFTVDEFTVRIRDLGSTNGTLVNGERIRGAVILNSGDVVTIGKIDLEVQIQDPTLETAAEMALETDTQSVKPTESAADQPAAAVPQVIDPPSSHEVPSTAATQTEMPVADTSFMPTQQPSTGDTQFSSPMQMPMQPALGYPQMGYPPMMPYGYPGYPPMYPQQMGYPPMGGGYPQQPAPQPPAAEPSPAPGASVPDELPVKLPDPEETGAKPPEPKPAAAGEEQKTAAAKDKEEAPKKADDIIQQYLKRRPTGGGKK